VKRRNLISILNKVSEEMTMTADMGFDKREALFDWIVVWGVWRKINELDPAGSYAH
jgi:hypothetical protein